MPSADLQTFLQSMSAGGSRDALERYDEDAFGRLDDDEAKEAVQACVARIVAGTNDPRATRLLNRFFRFEPRRELRAALPNLDGNETKAGVLRLLFEVEGRDKDLQALADLAVDGRRGGRLEAVYLLTQLDEEPETVARSLARAAADPVRDVRRLAVFNVYERLDFAQAEATAPSRHSTASNMVLSDLPSVIAEGARLVAEIVEEALGGASPDLGLIHPSEQTAVHSFEESLSERNPIEGVTELSGRARDWAEEVLLALLDSDARAVPVLATLGTPRAIAALRDLARVELAGSEAARAALVTLDAVRVAAHIDSLKSPSLTAEEARVVGADLADLSPEALFDAAVALAAAEDDVRAAFLTGALAAAAPTWAEANRDDLTTALGLSED